MNIKSLFRNFLKLAVSKKQKGGGCACGSSSQTGGYRYDANSRLKSTKRLKSRISQVKKTFKSKNTYHKLDKTKKSNKTHKKARKANKKHSLGKHRSGKHRSGK